MSSVPVLLRPKRSMGAFVADAVVEERHEDELVVTEHPVEMGAVVSDHAYKRPAHLMLEYCWAAGSAQNADGNGTFLADLYQRLLQLQVDRTLFQVFTGKRVYDNMILKSIAEVTEKRTENILLVRVVCQEVIIVTTQTTAINDAARQLFPQQTSAVVNQGTVSLGSAVNFNDNPLP